MGREGGGPRPWWGEEAAVYKGRGVDLREGRSRPCRRRTPGGVPVGTGTKAVAGWASAQFGSPEVKKTFSKNTKNRKNLIKIFLKIPEKFT